MIEMLNAIESTLQDLNIKSSYDNLNKLLGCIQVLRQVRDNLQTLLNQENPPVQEIEIPEQNEEETEPAVEEDPIVIGGE